MPALTVAELMTIDETDKARVKNITYLLLFDDDTVVDFDPRSQVSIQDPSR
jgi:hypothetical protein